MPARATTAEALVDDFYEAAPCALGFVAMFDDIPDVECFVKDLEGRRVRVSEGIWRRLGFRSAAEMVGKKDHELFPPYVADQYVRSDRQVLETGLPVVGQFEIWVNAQGVLDWFVVSKYPVCSRSGRVVGIMGTLRTAPRGQRAFTPGSALGKVMEHVREHFKTGLSVGELAAVCGLSERQLRRRFAREVGMGLAEFIIKTRIQIASDQLVRTQNAMSQIALEVGFCDQSAFCRAFRQQLGVSPGAYRRRYSGVTG